MKTTIELKSMEKEFMPLEIKIQKVDDSVCIFFDSLEDELAQAYNTAIEKVLEKKLSGQSPLITVEHDNNLGANKYGRHAWRINGLDVGILLQDKNLLKNIKETAAKEYAGNKIFLQTAA
ncbi:MAG: hypothetical protein PHT40_00235 [Patescibacteria group bacterium]|nr:hypothetical protein [Patescibacteria group bacterium]